jgi:hypothetical protein
MRSTVEINRSNNNNHTANPVSPKPGEVQSPGYWFATKGIAGSTAGVIVPATNGSSSTGRRGVRSGLLAPVFASMSSTVGTVARPQ